MARWVASSVWILEPQRVCEWRMRVEYYADTDTTLAGFADGATFSSSISGGAEAEVSAELRRIVDEVIALYSKDGKALPPPTSGRDFANKMQNAPSAASRSSR